MVDERLLQRIKPVETAASSCISHYATQYRILEVTGLGTMSDGTPAYIKRITIPPEDSIGPENYEKELRRIAEQVSIGRQLDHPNHTQLIDYDSEEDTHRLYYKVGSGKDLRTIVKERNLDTDEVLTIIEQVAAALTYTHRKNPPIIHGDLSPGNIVYDPENRHVTVIDHGASIAHVIREEILTTRMLVTNGYAAPEVLGGNPTPKSDIYGLGMNLSYLLTKIDQSEFLNWNGQLKRKELEELLKNNTANHHLVHLWKQLVAENPSERPSAEEVLKYVGRIKNGEGLEEKIGDIKESNSPVIENDPIHADFWTTQPEHVKRAMRKLRGIDIILGGIAGLAAGVGFIYSGKEAFQHMGPWAPHFFYGVMGVAGVILGILNGNAASLSFRPRFLYNYFLRKEKEKEQREATEVIVPASPTAVRSITAHNITRRDEKSAEQIDGFNEIEAINKELAQMGNFLTLGESMLGKPLYGGVQRREEYERVEKREEELLQRRRELYQLRDQSSRVQQASGQNSEDSSLSSVLARTERNENALFIDSDPFGISGLQKNLYLYLKKTTNSHGPR